MAHHALLTWRSAAVMLTFVGFFGFLSTAYRGPISGKWDLPPKMADRFQGFPGYDNGFNPHSHPALQKSAE